MLQELLELLNKLIAMLGGTPISIPDTNQENPAEQPENDDNEEEKPEEEPKPCPEE